MGLGRDGPDGGARLRSLCTPNNAPEGKVAIYFRGARSVHSHCRLGTRFELNARFRPRSTCLCARVAIGGRNWKSLGHVASEGEIAATYSDAAGNRSRGLCLEGTHFSANKTLEKSLFPFLFHSIDRLAGRFLYGPFKLGTGPIIEFGPTLFLHFATVRWN